ncbi:NUDIX domain-containing protein [Sphingobacterium bovisgrunnientis]|jgi:8-oxo-dGTP diphosphatase|uniref:NUDIX domain-containing protein n=1 Tax=Sphingobacterium bovisgrunnientis TaxID=1874697 RepID=UPI00135B599D|nr:NUDIX domain-containing protein [Sphingobacterium bovisgrunnientis]
MSQNKIVIASALLLNADNDLLVVRKKKSTFYMLPGGKVESNESYKDALLRELKEELELEFTYDDFEYLGKHETQAVNEKNTIVQGNIFLLKTPLIHLPNSNAELEEVRFVSKVTHEKFQLANLLKEFALPIWMNL